MAQALSTRTHDRLVVALLMGDLIDQFNRALAVRKILLTLKYKPGGIPMLSLQMPGVDQPQVWMTVDPRKGKCLGYWPTDPTLCAFVKDVNAFLAKENAFLILTAHSPLNRKRTAKLQIHVRDAKTSAITLMEASRGSVVKSNAFQLPEGSFK